MKRTYNLSSKDIDYHLQRAQYSLLKLKVIKEKGNRITHNISSLDRLISCLDILKAHPDKGDLIRDSIHNAYAKCFVNTFGNGLVTIPQGAASNMHEIFVTIRESESTVPKNTIEDLIKISEFVGMSTDIETEVSYIVTVMARILGIKRCYSETYGSPSGASQESVLTSAKPIPCELWTFTDSYSRPIDIVKWAKVLSSMNPVIVRLLYYRMVVEPLFFDRFGFKVVDEKLGITGEERTAIHLAGMLAAKSGSDFDKDMFWDPFKDQTIKKIMTVEKWVIKNARNLKEFEALEERVTKFVFEEYIARRLKLLDKEVRENKLSRKLIQSIFEEGENGKLYI